MNELNTNCHPKIDVEHFNEYVRTIENNYTCNSGRIYTISSMNLNLYVW